MKKIKRILKREEGLSLIEIVLIIVIMGISVMPISRLSVTNMTGTVDAFSMSRSQFYAKMLMEEIIGDYLSKDRSVGGLTNVMGIWDGYSSSSDVQGLSGRVDFSTVVRRNNIAYSTITVNVTDSETAVSVQLKTILAQ